MTDPAAYLHDVIDDPEKADDVKVRRAILRVTAKIADSQKMSSLHERLTAAIKELSDACSVEAVDTRHVAFNIGMKQVVARQVLTLASEAGRQ